MGETISDMDIKLAQQDNKIQFLEDKKGTPDSNILEELNRLDLNKISSKNEYDRILNRLKKHLLNMKTKEIRSKKTIKLNKRIALTMNYF